MINTLNETHLHRTLKNIYRIQNGGTEESQVGAYIADILNPEKREIIEIQTGTLSRLLKKTQFFLSENYRVRIVYPIAVIKNIETKDEVTGKTVRRKSPLKKNIYSIFRELTSLIPVLMNKNFTLEILEVEITEERKMEAEAVQSKNKRRRFKKNWQKTGKRLEQTGKTYLFNGTESYQKLIPASLPENFTSKDFFESLRKQNSSIKRNDANIMLWLYVKTDIIKMTGKKGKSFIYTKKECSENEL